MNIAICDDETNMLTVIKDKALSVLNSLNKTADISVFDSGEELLTAYDGNQKPFDIIFLDIKMDKLDGIKTAELIRRYDNNVKIVFVTSSAEYVFKGYEVKAYRYIMKNELEYGFGKVLKDIIKETEAPAEKPFIFTFGAETVSLSLSDICYFESEKRIVKIITDAEEYKTYSKLVDIEQAIDNEYFIRCHQSYLVNAKKIDKISKNEIHLKNGKTVPVSKKYQKDVKEAYLWSMR